MLRKETLKQAIDAIAARDPEIGYSLADLFASGRIDVVETIRQGADSGFEAYVFNGQRVAVRKTDYFAEGSAAVEQSLLIQYGEMAEKLALASPKRPVTYGEADGTIRTAGLTCLLHYEISRARDRLEGGPVPGDNGLFPHLPPVPDPRSLLNGLRREAPPDNLPANAEDPRVLFTGAVNADTPSFFISFPYSRNALMQVAGLGLSYFSIRFVLSCLAGGTARNLFACIVDGAVSGLVYLKGTHRFRYPGLEIEYIASAREAETERGTGLPVHRGVGTFLVAGVWMLWKNITPRVREISLNAEIKALGFYEEVGFEKKRPYVYALKRPAGYLLNGLTVMADRSRSVSPVVISEILEWIRTHVRRLARTANGDPDRGRSLAFIKLCLLSRSQPELARTAAVFLMKYKSRISEAEGLLQWAGCHGRIRIVDTPLPRTPPLLVFKDDALHSHLQGIFHLENAKRLKAIDTVLDDPTLSGKWSGVGGRMAAAEELAWVHTPEHIARIAATSGAALHSLDPDTQTTATSYDTARRAVGGVFSLLDEILSTRSRRGFAAVRPPGHHAEPDRAMGFCLFNNAALGACYLKHVRGLKRVMIVDIDAHHGNGTQAAFYNSNDVLFVSMHQFPCYPGTGNFSEIGRGPGEGHSVNIPLEKGMGDFEFVQVIDKLVTPLACAYEPDMILVSCGFDLYRHDRLAGLAGTPLGYAMITRLLCAVADLVCGGRIAFIMEGGYSIKGIEHCSLKLFQELCGTQSFEQTRLEKIISDAAAAFDSLQKTIAIHRKYWSILSH